MTSYPLRALWGIASAMLAFPASAAPNDPPPGFEQHVLNRVGYGTSPADRIDLEFMGVDDWIEYNLGPTDTTLDPRLASLLALYPDPGPHNYGAGGNTHQKLSEREIAYALYSRQPLREQMVDFWHNHFSTDYSDVQGAFRRRYEVDPLDDEYAVFFLRRDQDFYREHGLGRFEDLLLYSARSVPMLIYLNTVNSEADDPNENYAREVMELHTLGEGQYYDETDVAVAATLFTGWDVALDVSIPELGSPDVAPLPLSQAERDALRPLGDIDGDAAIGLSDLLYIQTHWGEQCNQGWECGDLDGNGMVGLGDLLTVNVNWGTYVFTGHLFDEDDYTPGTKELFGGDLRIEEGSTTDERYAEATTFLRHLANRPETMEFISSKLIAKFVANVPHTPDASWPADLAALRLDCVVTWMLTDGDIASVLRTIFTSQVFRESLAHRWTKPVTPLESSVRAVRAVDYADRGVGLVTTEDQLSQLRQAVISRGYYEMFREKLPTGNSENDESSSASLLGAISFLVEVYGQDVGSLSPPWSEHFPGLDASSSVLPRTILEHFYGPYGYSNNDAYLARLEHQALLAQGINQLDEMCAKLAPFLASFPQGFQQ